MHEKYRIIEKLGNQKKRKFGEVFQVQNKQDESLAVLKAVNKSSTSSIVIDQLRNEAKFNFNSAQLPQILDLYDSDSELMLVSGFKPGIPMDKYWTSIKKKDRLNFLTDFIEKFDSLYCELRDRRIVHCDIKPSNILINNIGGSFDVYLLDFGLAVHKNEIQDRKLIFPLGFAAPELLLNELDLLDERTDIYTMGILIWRLYTGELPLTHPNPSIFTNLQLTHPLPEHSRISKQLFSVLNKMCFKYQFQVPPNKLDLEIRKKQLIAGMNSRYNSFGEVIEDLQKIKENKGRWWPFTT